MTPILKRLISQLKSKGYDDNAARSIAVASLQRSGNLKHGSEEPTAKGVKRGNMSPAERAKDRAAKRSGRSTADFTYNSHTNRATLRRGARRKK